jgi:predicted CoA-binding protein
MPMSTIDQTIADFLAQRRIAVAGVSREAGGAHGGNAVYAGLKKRGYEVFAVNPNADTVLGDPCYRSLAAIPGGVDAVVIATAPSVTPSVVEDCRRLGIARVWMHSPMGQGSVSREAAAACVGAGIACVAGACPMMYGAGADGGHRLMRTLLRFTGGLPKGA